MTYFPSGTTCDDPGFYANTFRYATSDMDPDVSFSLSNLKSGGRIYYSCIRPGYELMDDGGNIFNYTECDGADWSPELTDFSCKGGNTTAFISPCMIFCAGLKWGLLPFPPMSRTHHKREYSESDRIQCCLFSVCLCEGCLI